MDIAMAEGPDGRPIAHRPDCWVITRMRAAGEPVMTIFEVEGDLGELSCAKHVCLEQR